MRIALAQLNLTVGDLDGNARRIQLVYEKAKEKKADLVVTPELSLTGYHPGDMLFRQSFLDDTLRKIAQLAEITVNGPGLLLGAPWSEGDYLYNAALLLENGTLTERVFKHDLPNYGVFDEKRFFASADLAKPITFKGRKLGVMICEDMWTPVVPDFLAKKGASLFISLNASPYESQKFTERRAVASHRVAENKVPLIYVNLVGGQDDLVFDGECFVMDASGELKFVSERWVEDVLFVDLEETDRGVVIPKGKVLPIPSRAQAVYDAIVLGIRDYVFKNGFSDIVLGLSGGMDSALVAVMAVEALGVDHVHATMMPSRYTSQDSFDDAEVVANKLGCSYGVVPITMMTEAVERSLHSCFKGKPADLTEENIQARCRGLMLMALANKFDRLVLSTGNKSEYATGYATLYGDMCGGYAPLKDVYKTEVYELARYAVEKNGHVIPERIFTKPPSAELRPGQKDQDSLPSYDVLDGILKGLIENEASFSALVDQGYDHKMVQRVWSMIRYTEYKRQQAAPGPKVTRRHLTKDRRYPITNGYPGN